MHLGDRWPAAWQRRSESNHQNARARSCPTTPTSLLRSWIFCGLRLRTLLFIQLGHYGDYQGEHRVDMLTHAKSMLISSTDMHRNSVPAYTPEKNTDFEIWLKY